MINFTFLFDFDFRVQYKSKSLSLSLVIALTLSGQGGGDRLHILVVGHAGLAVGLVHVDRLHDDAYGEGGGRLRDAGIGINAFLSVFIYSVRRKKTFFSLRIFIHISA